jgi:uncharacterized membrane protein
LILAQRDRASDKPNHCNPGRKYQPQLGGGTFLPWELSCPSRNYYRCNGEAAFLLPKKPGRCPNQGHPRYFMRDDNPSSTMAVSGLPIHSMFVPFPIACFVGALVTDLVYWRTANMMWETFSIWLITAGLIMGAFAAIAGATDFLSNRRIRALSPGWPHALGNILALILGLLNAFVHSRDGYTSVVPEGLTLSVLVVIILAFTSWMGRAMVYRYGVGAVQ